MTKIKMVELITTEREVDFKNAICRSIALMQDADLEVDVQYSNIDGYYSALILGKETKNKVNTQTKIKNQN